MNHTTVDWVVRHHVYIEMWQRPDLINESRPYDPSQYLEYRRGFQVFGLYMVYLRGQIESGLGRPLAPPQDSVEVLGYIPGDFGLQRVVCFQL
jgi:hypothetical protein